MLLICLFIISCYCNTTQQLVFFAFQFQTVAAVWRDRQCLEDAYASGLVGNYTVDFLQNQSADGDDMSVVTIDVTTGQAEDFREENIDSPDAYPDFGDLYLMYCCYGPQFVEGGEGDTHRRRRI